MTHPVESRKNPPRVITKGDGVHITDIDGARVLDAVGGLWNVNLGYSCDTIKQAGFDQMCELPYYSAFRGTSNDKAIELSWELTQFFADDGLTRAFFTSGGSDSVEVALKLARQYHRVRGDASRTKFMSIKRGYHGTHFGGASVNGNTKFRQAYEPLLPGCFQISTPCAYRNVFDTDDLETAAHKSIASLEEEIAYQGAETIAAFIMEPVMGAGGVVAPHPDYMKMVRDVCDRNGILLISDEVITAFGRLGTESGARHWGVKPDLMTTAKAITNGYFPLGAVMISEKVADVFENDTSGKGGVDMGYTYSGHPVGAAMALETLAQTRRVQPWKNAAVRGAELIDGLRALKREYDIIGDVRGVGLMCGIEIVTDRAAKTPMALDAMTRLQNAAYDAGVMLRVAGNTVIFSPPLVIEPAHVTAIIEATEVGVNAI